MEFTPGEFQSNVLHILPCKVNIPFHFRVAVVEETSGVYMNIGITQTFAFYSHSIIPSCCVMSLYLLGKFIQIGFIQR